MVEAGRNPEAKLRSLEGKRLGRLTLTLPVILRPRGREKECRYFQLKGLKEGKLSKNPMVEGFYSVGRSSINLPSYFDIDYSYLLFFNDGEVVDLVVEGVDIELFKTLSTLVDQGGKIIVSLTSPYRLHLLEETFRQLDIGVHPQDTYVGKLLTLCGCGYAFKLWLIREGGAEGPAALQGEKAAHIRAT